MSLLYFIPLGIIQLEIPWCIYRLRLSKRIASSFPPLFFLFSFLRSMSLNNKFYSRYTNNTRIIQQFSFSFLANFLHNFSQFKYQPYLAKFKIKQSYSWLAKRFFRIRIFLRRIFPKNQHPIINTINKISSRKRESNGRIRNRSK